MDRSSRILAGLAALKMEIGGLAISAPRQEWTSMTDGKTTGDSAEIVYEVSPTVGTQRWTVTRDSVALDVSPYSRTLAVAVAFHAARQEREQSGRDVSVWSVKNGKRKKEWPLDVI